MKTLNELNRYPTIMTIEQEVELIGDLMQMTVEYIASNRPGFARRIEDLAISHVDAGCLGLTQENQQVFVRFANRLDELDRDGVIDLEEWAQPIFRVSYDEIAQEHGAMD